MATPKTLNVHVPWTELARVLGIDITSEAIPAVAACPLCHKPTLHVYEDTAGGNWHHCMNAECGTYGDMIELVSRVWKLDTEDTLHELARVGLPVPTQDSDIDKYIKSHQGIRQRVLSLWQASQAHYLRGSTVINSLKHKFGLGCNVSVQRWKDGPGKLFGSIQAGEAEKTFSPGECTNKRPGDVYNRSPARIFTGHNWTDVLVFPFWASPGRICAFQFIGRSGGDTDRTVKPTEQISKSVKEGGLFGLPAVFDCSATGITVFAVDDVTLAAKLHVRHALHSRLPLPLVAWQTGRSVVTKKAWQSLSCMCAVFWAQQITAELIDQAMLANGRISLAGPEVNSKENFDHYIRLCSTPAHLLKRVEKQAKPWDVALADWVRSSYDIPVKALFARLERLGRPIQTVAYALPEDVRSRVLQVAAPAYAIEERHVLCGVHQIIERGGQWYQRHSSTKEEKIICNATIRIDKIEVLKKKTIYAGRIVFNGETVRFSIDFAKMGRFPYLLRELLVRANKGLLQFAPGWRTKLLDITLAFQKPVIVNRKADKAK